MLAGRVSSRVGRCRVMVADGAPASGPLLSLSAPLSLWGGVEAPTGLITDPRHPERGESVAGTVLVVPAPVGSSSSSAIMLELMREKTAPAAVILGRPDAILALGVVVGRELGYPPLPVLAAGPEELAALAGRSGIAAEVGPDGWVFAGEPA